MKKKWMSVLTAALMATCAATTVSADWGPNLGDMASDAQHAAEEAINKTAQAAEHAGYFSRDPADVSAIRLSSGSIIFYGKLNDGVTWDMLPVNPTLTSFFSQDSKPKTHSIFEPRIGILLHLQDLPAQSSGSSSGTDKEKEAVIVGAGVGGGQAVVDGTNVAGAGGAAVTGVIAYGAKCLISGCDPEGSAQNGTDAFVNPLVVAFAACYPLLDFQRFRCEFTRDALDNFSDGGHEKAISRLLDPNYYNAKVSFIAGENWSTIQYGPEKLMQYSQSPTIPLASLIATVVDTDGDLLPDGWDNCPGVSNVETMESPSWKEGSYAYQKDSDYDGIGDVCDNCNDQNDPTNQCNPGTPWLEQEPEAVRTTYFSQIEKEYGLDIDGDTVIFYAMFGSKKHLHDFPLVAGKRIGVWDSVAWPYPDWTNENGELDWQRNPVKLGCVGIMDEKGVICTASLEQVAQMYGKSSAEFKAAYDAGDENIKLFFGGGLFQGRAAYESPFLSLKVLRANVENQKDYDDDGIPDLWDDALVKQSKSVGDDDPVPSKDDSQAAIGNSGNAYVQEEVEIADVDQDAVPDDLDACPDIAGAASLIPASNGCPADGSDEDLSNGAASSGGATLAASGCSMVPASPVNPSVVLLLLTALAPLVARRRT